MSDERTEEGCTGRNVVGAERRHGTRRRWNPTGRGVADQVPARAGGRHTAAKGQVDGPRCDGRQGLAAPEQDTGQRGRPYAVCECVADLRDDHGRRLTGACGDAVHPDENVEPPRRLLRIELVALDQLTGRLQASRPVEHAGIVDDDLPGVDVAGYPLGKSQAGNPQAESSVADSQS